MLSGTKREPADIFERIRLLLTETQSLLTEAKPVLQDAKALAADARQLIAENKVPISRAISQLDNSASALEKLASSGNKLVVNNERKLSSTISDFKVASENLKVTSTYAKILIRSLSQRPSQLIWETRSRRFYPANGRFFEAPRLCQLTDFSQSDRFREFRLNSSSLRIICPSEAV